MQLLTCADQHPPQPGNLGEHASILFMLNCYDGWSVTPPSLGEAEDTDADEDEDEDETILLKERRHTHA
jgi:hypothetical protein